MSKHKFNRNFAIIIGINDYGNGIRELETAVPDAHKLAQILQEQHQNLKQQYQAQNKYEVQLLLNKRVTLSKVKELIEDFKQGQIAFDNEKVVVTESDRVLFYFAGHGIALEALENQEGPVGYLIPQDATLGDSNTYLPMQELHDALNALPCRHMLAILDCCFAGAFRWASLKREIQPKVTVYKERYDRFISDAAWQVITSAADDQKALDSLGQRGTIKEGNEVHSPFAKALFDALRGGPDEAADFNEDCIITATELYSYLRDKIEILTENQYKRQTPSFCLLKKHDKGEFIFLLPNFDRDKLQDAPPLNQKNNPYRGLQSYDEKDSGLFFGRENLIKQLYQPVVSDQQALTLVLGASGTGKSSLMKAGLLPRLRQSTEYQFQILDPMRPGESPLKALAQVCLPLTTTITVDELAKNEQALANIIQSWSKTHPKTKLLLPVDQFEELITLCKSDEEREQFQKLIRSAIAQYPNNIDIVITLRLDFEAQFQNSILKDFWNDDARFVVPPMTQDELREAIEKPALEKVVYFDPPSLVDELINEVVQMPGALPLLSFTLSQLYLKYLEERRDNRALTKEDYKELGRVVGSITKRANQEYDQLVKEDPAYKDTIRRVMLRMISLQGGELARRQVPKSELVYPNEKENERVQTLIKRFSEARLIVEGSNSQGEPYVEPAHDALVQGWDKLLVWKRKNQSTIVLQRLLTPASVDWKNEQSRQFLWNTNPRLNVLKDILDSNDNWLNTVETEFIQQSIRQRNKDTRSRWGIGITVSIVLSTFLASATTLVATVLSNLKNKPDVIFASPGQEIHGHTGYKYVYTLNTVKTFPPAVQNQIMIGIKKNTPACINVGQVENGEKSQKAESFKINAPKKPGIYYVQFTFALERGCDQDAINSWLSEAYRIYDRSTIGIIIVANVFDFSVYKEIWSAYSKNVPSTAVATDEQYVRGDIYVSLIDFEFEKK
ncbi:MAG: caspase family protein [Nostoc sp.]|uniref:nSTAND1 domain-containing NTPase n=1 Tax=Nostoc sp. TaxID=1180 RepID=UPI002FF79A53